MRFLAIVAAGLRLLAICHGEEAWIPQLSRESEPTRTVCVFDQDGGHTCTQKTTCHDIETEEECGRAFYAMCIPPEASYCLWEESVCTSINERATNYTGEVVCGNIDNKKECEAQFVGKYITQCLLFDLTTTISKNSHNDIVSVNSE